VGKVLEYPSHWHRVSKKVEV